MQGYSFQDPVADQSVHGQVQRHKSPGDCGGTGASVGHQHVAVNSDRPLSQGFEIGYGPQRSADESLDFLRPPADAPRIPVPG